MTLKYTVDVVDKQHIKRKDLQNNYIMIFELRKHVQMLETLKPLLIQFSLREKRAFP